MSRVYAIADNIISPLGLTTEENIEAIINGQSAIKRHVDERLFQQPVYAAKIAAPTPYTGYTKLESLFIQSIQNVLIQKPGLDLNRTVLVMSSTKGNIDLLSEDADQIDDRVLMPVMAEAVSNYFGFNNAPILVSNACISGVSAILTAADLIKNGTYDHAVVTGGDLLTEFVISGFQSFMAIANAPCRPYDKDRAGINLGEASATLLLSSEAADSASIEVLGGGQSNDANHISGPSRTGKGLKKAVEAALKATGTDVADIDYINAHGTATPFNDAMESLAFYDLGLSQVPLNSLKGYFGHTLGAAGILESIITFYQMKKHILFKSPGYEENGVPKEMEVIMEHRPTVIDVALKTISGFGGCNAAVIFKTLNG